VDIYALLLTVDSALSAEEKLALAEKTYVALYIENEVWGKLPLHDGQEAIFYRDRWEHATHTSSDLRRKPTDKSKLSPERIARLPWIGPLIAGTVPNSVCYDIYDGSRNKRLYAFTPAKLQPYVVWLEATKRDWKFSSAYLTTHEVFRKYTAQPGAQKLAVFAQKNTP
jgi:hypothetical protein